MLSDERGHDPRQMIEALRALPDQPPPSRAVVPGLLDGLDNIHAIMARWLDDAPAEPPRLATTSG